MQKSDIRALFEDAARIIRTFTYEDFRCMYEDIASTSRFLKFLDLMRQVLQIDPNYPGALNNIAVMAKMVSFPEALHAAEHLIQVDHSYGSYLVLGKTLLQARDFERAGVVLEEALAMGSDSLLWIHLAQARLGTGRLQEALNCVESAFKHAPGEQEIEIAIHLRDKLLRELTRVHGAKPNDPDESESLIESECSLCSRSRVLGIRIVLA